VREVDALGRRFTNLEQKTPEEISTLYDFEIRGQ
jgi:hypothetical protein